MPEYKGVLTTEDRLWAGSFDHISIKVVGTDGESKRKTLPHFLSYPDSDFEIEVDRSIGKLVLIELQKSSGILLPQDSWYPAKVELKSPEGKTFYFPIHRWITDDEVHQFREATACLVVDDTDPLAIHSRTEELKLRKEQYWYVIYSHNGFIMAQFTCLFSIFIASLRNEVGSFTLTFMQFVSSVNAFTPCLLFVEYVQQNWMKDSLFGYQFLNGVNPMVIRRCSVLPENFPVTDQMVFLDGGKSLAEEMQNGNIFLCDYKLLDGLKANEVNGKQQYLMAPLVLLHKTPKKDQLMPIAIQLKQEPSKDNPIFFPTDSEYDWLLAKMFVRSADFQVHQLNSHLLRTHLLAEVFSVSILRNLPMVHPLYKLLVPNTRYTLQINFLARELLISDGGFFNKFTASGGEPMQKILQKANSSITYTSLCVRDDIKERGLESVPHYYYRDDAFQIWDIINRFVQGVLGYYYKDDSDVQRDTELQTWVLEIFEHGFLSRPESGMPQRLNTVAELVKFITMVIFTCSAQHGAVNNGQFDYGSWMPNTPATLQRPPPTTKGTSDLSSLLETLPDVNATVHGMVPFGHYPEEYFSEIVPRQQMHLFKGELGLLNSKIEARNLGLKIPYTFLDPALMENSVAI
uniref:Arachidonate 15-lipoxygenase B-like n=1 Tax=Gadus morhua TaxID=8049 RepID=A0A8C4ZNC8_GADMO